MSSMSSIPPWQPQRRALRLCERHGDTLSAMCPNVDVCIGHVMRLFVDRNRVRLFQIEGDACPAWREPTRGEIARLYHWCCLLFGGCPVCFDTRPDEFVAAVFRAYDETQLSFELGEFAATSPERMLLPVPRVPGAEGRVWLLPLRIDARPGRVYAVGADGVVGARVGLAVARGPVWN